MVTFTDAVCISSCGFKLMYNILSFQLNGPLLLFLAEKSSSWRWILSVFPFLAMSSYLLHLWKIVMLDIEFLVDKFFSFSVSNITSHLTSSVKILLILLGIALYIISHFLLMLSRSFVFVSWQLDYQCSLWLSLSFSSWNSLNFLDVQINALSHLRRLNHYLFKYPCSFSSSSKTFLNMCWHT